MYSSPVLLWTYCYSGHVKNIDDADDDDYRKNLITICTLLLLCTPNFNGKIVGKC